MQITAAHLYDYVLCPHRVALDAFGDSGARDAISPFVRMLWERGSLFEKTVLGELADTAVQIDAEGPDRVEATRDAMASGAEVILGGRIMAADLTGEPDLLLKSGHGYIPADVKSGRGEDGEGSEAKLKPHYAVQLAIYAEILERSGLSAGRRGEIWDVRGERVSYDMNERRNSRTIETWWSWYENCRDEVRAILARQRATRGAIAAACALCHWQTVCLSELESAGDLTLVPSLGRALRDTMMPVVGTLTEFAESDCDAFIRGSKTIFPGLGADRLRLFHLRARLLTRSNSAPLLRTSVDIPEGKTELFFDIEADPMRDVTYLHGFVERQGGDDATRTFTGFFADDATDEAEREAFRQAIEFMRSKPDSVIFYYSKYERTMYRKLQASYPDICDAEEIERLFARPRSIDLYFDVVTRATEWPTRSHSIKALAKFLGFAWRDVDPSGAASIEWYHRWIEERDPAVKQRILDYNEDDCIATAVLLDKVRQLAKNAT